MDALGPDRSDLHADRQDAEGIREPYEPPVLADAGEFALRTRGDVGLIEEYHSRIPH